VRHGRPPTRPGRQASRWPPLNTICRCGRPPDPDALAQLLRLRQPDLRRYAQRSCLISDVDDAVQEALLVLSRRLASVRMLAAFSGWLFQVVKHACHKLARMALDADPWDEVRAEQWPAGTRPVCASSWSTRSSRCRPIICK
jgi:DNA-directed RNA polymerase specialized sigma24 family protein